MKFLFKYLYIDKGEVLNTMLLPFFYYFLLQTFNLLLYSVAILNRNDTTQSHFKISDKRSP